MASSESSRLPFAARLGKAGVPSRRVVASKGLIALGGCHAAASATASSDCVMALALPSTVESKPRRPGPGGPTPVGSARASRLGDVLGIVAVGVAVQALGYALGFKGHDGPALTLFFVGLLIIFIPCAWRLLGPRAGPGERLRVVVVLGLALVTSSFIATPLLPTGFDELLHETTLWQLPYFHRLFTQNTVLPISPYYPGLELTTLGVKAVTGLPSVASELVVVGLSRLILVVALYLAVGRLTGSERAGGIGVLVYSASPQFYSFNAAYSYQTLALAFGAGAVYFLLLTVDRPRPRADWHYLVCFVCLAALAITHHLVSWLTAGFLVVWWLFLVPGARADAVARSRRRLIGGSAVFSVAACSLWAGLSAGTLVPYLGPILTGAVRGLIGILTRHGSERQLFHGTNSVTPLWQEVVILASAAIFLTVIIVALFAVLFRSALRGGWQLAIPVGLATTYPLILLSSLSPTAAEVGQRLSSFSFFGIALLVAAMLLWARRRVPLAILTGLATICFLGSMIFGSGPSWGYVPGPYVPSADQRSIDAFSIAAAKWASAHLPVDSRIAADRDNGALMAAVGHLQPVTALSGAVNVGPIYFDPIVGNYDRYLIRKGRIRYLLVDDRLLRGPPAVGFYFEPGETQGKERLTTTDLSKFSTAAGFHRVYDNGPIQIYNLSAILGTLAPTTLAPPRGIASSAGDNFVLAEDGVLLAIGLVLFRRRGWCSADTALAGLLCTSVLLAGAGLLAVFTPSAPYGPNPVLVGGLVVLLALGRSWRGHHRRRRPGSARWLRGRGLAIALLGMTMLALALAVELSVASKQWGPSPSAAPAHLRSSTR